MSEPTARELIAQTKAALDAGDGEYAKMVFAALIELLVRQRNERFAHCDRARVGEPGACDDGTRTRWANQR